MNLLKAIQGIISVFIVLPIWFFLLYRILQAVNASELMWFLFWIYIPASMIFAWINNLITQSSR